MRTSSLLGTLVMLAVLAAGCATARAVNLGDVNADPARTRVEAAGTWSPPPEDTNGFGSTWFAIDPDRPGNAVTVQWSLGMTCPSYDGTLEGNRIRVKEPGIVIVVESARKATAVLFDRGRPAMTLRLVKTSDERVHICE